MSSIEQQAASISQHGESLPERGVQPPRAPVKPGSLIRLPTVMLRTGLGKTSLYALANAGKFPTSVRLSTRAVAWREEDVDAWIAGRAKNTHQP